MPKIKKQTPAQRFRNEYRGFTDTDGLEGMILEAPSGMRRYLLFAGPIYYPQGGWDDFIGSWQSLRTAKAKADEAAKCSGRESWAQVVDATTGMAVYVTVFNGRRKRKSQTVEA